MDANNDRAPDALSQGSSKCGGKQEYQFCEVFQAVPLCDASANTFRPRAPPFLANTSGRGPTKQFTAGRQLGLLQIRIALQEVCVSIVIIHSQINKDKGNKQLIVAWIQL